MSLPCFPTASSQLTSSPSPSRAFAPSTPHSHGVIAPANNAESDRREKRARRFEDEGPSGSGSTGGNSPYLGRVGRAGTYGGYAPPEPAAVYDSVRMACGLGSVRGADGFHFDRTLSTGTGRLLSERALSWRSPSCD